MPESNPDWYRLIAAWIARGRTGLTLPFLVGARQVLSEAPLQTDSSNAVNRLIDEIVSGPISDSLVYARWCDNVGAPVLELRRAQDHADPAVANGVAFRAPDGRLSLVASPRLAAFLEVDSAPTQIRNALVADAVAHVAAGNFSRRGVGAGELQYMPFDDGDFAFIRQAGAPRL